MINKIRPKVVSFTAKKQMINLRKAKSSDLDLLFQWRNNPDIVSLSASQKSVKLDEHSQWFNESINDPNKIYETNDLAKGDVMFSATGVTDGTLLKGVLIKKEVATTHSVVMRSKTKTIRHVSASHNLELKEIIA